jgi:hypothetical protein
MAGASDRHEVICIEAKRVCDFCFQEHRVERDFPVPGGVVIPPGTRPMIECNVDTNNVVCRVVEERPVGNKNDQTLVCLAITVPVTLAIGDTMVPQTITFLKQAVLCKPEGTDVDCQVTGNCCCFFDTTTNRISCVFDFCVVIQTQVIVRVLVPTLGMCAPKECRSVVGGCGNQMTQACRTCEPLDDTGTTGNC